MVVSQFIYPVDRHLDCFQVLAIMNKAIINFFVQVCVWTQVFNSSSTLLTNDGIHSNQFPFWTTLSTFTFLNLFLIGR